MADQECINNQNAFNQRRKMQLLNIPPTRYTPPSPYPTYTQFQLNMRRKAEILKYSANTTNTKTNNFTKSEKFAQLVSGNYQRRTIPQYDIVDSSKNNYVINCPTDSTPLPSSSSGVPGPTIYLFEDPTIPLYNYVVTRSYSILDEKNDQKWNTNPYNNILFSNGNETLLTLLGIRSYIDKPNYSFSIQTSVGIYVAGIIKNTGYNTPVTFSISNVVCNIYYKDSLVLSPTVIFGGLNTLTLNIQNSSFGTFNALLHVGNISINNFPLTTNVDMVYDIKLIFTITNTSHSSYSLTSINASCNLSQNNVNSSNNCVITGTQTILSNIGFVITGV
jgi:hypothetical protein